MIPDAPLMPRPALRRRPSRVRQPFLVAAVTAAAAAMLAGCGSPSASTSGPSPTASPDASIAPVVRTVLAEALPDELSGYSLQLVRYVIQPSTTLARHHHPGTQVALMEQGRLDYTVLTGEVVVHQADGGTRTIAAGGSDVLTAGEWIVEREPVIHFGANQGPDVVVILATTLLEADQPPATADPTAGPSGG
jgi:quercetin dioxygenase-like cupin family protein